MTFVKGEHNSPATEFKKGRTAPTTAFKKGCKSWCKGKTFTVEHRRKLSESHFGIKQTQRTILKRTAKTTGKKRTEEIKKKLSELNKGEKHYRWNPDRQKILSSKRMNSTYDKEWTKNVYKRDSFICQTSNENCSGRIEAHHILGWVKYPDLRHIINNGITLCHTHHPRKKEDERKLIPFFQKMVAKTN